MSDPDERSEGRGSGGIAIGSSDSLTPSEEAVESILRRIMADEPRPPEPNLEPPHEDLDGFISRSTAESLTRQTPERWLSTGDKLGHFEILRELGRGGFGVVYQAFDSRLNRVVALKIPRPDRVQNAALWNTFAREVRLSAGLRHPAIVGIHDAFIADGVFYITSEYEDSETLAAYIGRHPGGVPVSVAAAIALTLAEALTYAHESWIVHRDLKPQNILVTRAGGKRPGDHRGAPETPDDLTPIRPKITDFGLGSILEKTADADTQSGFWQGTPPYLAPEQAIASRGPIDQRVDIYALGAVLYELLTGRPIYQAKTILDLCVILGRGTPPTALRQLRPNVPRDLETICMACLEHDVSRRYVVASAVLADLRAFSEHRAITRRPLPIWERVGRWSRRHPSYAGMAAVGLLMLGLGEKYQYDVVAKNKELSTANQKLTDTLGDLRKSRLSEQWARYDSDLLRASDEINTGRIEAAQATLNAHRPKSGEPDQREFAWHCLWNQATRQYVVTPLFDMSWWKTGEPGVPLETIKFDDAQRLFASTVVISPTAITGVNATSTSLRFDGRLEEVVVSTEQNGIARPTQFRAATGEIFQPLLDHPNVLRLSPDGKNLLLVGAAISPAKNKIFSLADGRKVTVWNMPAGDYCYSGDGRVIGTRIFGHEFCVPSVYDLETGRFARYDTANPDSNREGPSVKPGSPHTLLAVSWDGHLAAWASNEARIEVFDSWTGRLVWKLDEAEFGSSFPMSMAFSPDDRLLIIGDHVGRVTARSISTGKLIAEFPRRLARIAAVGFHPDPDTVAIVASFEDRIRFWKLPREAEPPLMALATDEEIWGASFASQGKTLVTGDDKHQIRVWDTRTHRQLKNYEDHKSCVTTVAVANDGKTLASGDFDGNIFVRDLERDGDGGKVRVGQLANQVRCLAWSPDGRYLACCGASSELFVWDRKTKDLYSRTLPTKDAHGLAWSPDGKRIVVVSEDRMISLWNSGAFDLKQSLKTRSLNSCVAFSPDSKLMVVGQSSGGFEIWNTETLQVSHSVDTASEVGSIGAVAFHPDGKTFATGGDDKIVRLWDVTTGRELARLNGHEAKVHAIAFHPDGKSLVSCDFTGKIQVWTASRGK